MLPCPLVYFHPQHKWWNYLNALQSVAVAVKTVQYFDSSLIPDDQRFYVPQRDLFHFVSAAVHVFAAVDWRNLHLLYSV